MKNLKSPLVCAVLLFVCYCTAHNVRSVSLQGGGDIQSGWQSAIRTAQAEKYTDGYWIGYSIERWMDPDSHIGCHGQDRDYGKTLEEIIECSIKAGSAQIPDIESKDGRILKQVAILFKISAVGNQAEIKKTRISNLDLPVDLDELPLIWLGHVEKDESARYIKKVYDAQDSRDVKEDLITVMGLHQDCQYANETLKGIVESDQATKLRKSAVFWLGQQAFTNVLPFLSKTARSDRSTDVREHAVFAIYLIKSEEADNELINLARKADSRSVRKKAIFWLGQKAGKKAAETLEDVAFNDGETEIQKQAVFALSQLKDGQGVSKLINVAKIHPNPKTRKQAIFWLGQSDDERALDVLVDIVKGK